ncbi:hypothetical protein ECHHL_0458 [Ehrlichia chaffeensis str. Heartland]|nr:hypothetical protein ECHHL_0458 [Ehrlichia chaffeensis str. Heartland]AHX09001.1 hypothetical protein ECHSTV_0588 [Ehrlichia chaffeensis str. Saint Vincent]AHX10572.1 hypothetical protein ECHWP_0455 [Ehrlichia chaffeensis str. West Paces]
MLKKIIISIKNKIIKYWTHLAYEVKEAVNNRIFTTWQL